MVRGASYSYSTNTEDDDRKIVDKEDDDSTESSDSEFGIINV
eukprot:UN11322